MRILVIDDEPVRAQFLLFGGHTHDVKVACGRSQVGFHLEMWRRWSPELICLDHDMPGFNGMEVVAAFPEIAATIEQAPIWVWSMNFEAAPRLRDDLARRAAEFGVLDPHRFLLQRAWWSCRFDTWEELVQGGK